MARVIVVSGTGLRKTKRRVFIADSRGSRLVHADDRMTPDELAKTILDDYGVKDSSHQIQLSYMFSNKTLKTMAHDTPPVYVTNTRQLQIFLGERKTKQLCLCVEITETEGSRVKKKKRFFSYSSEVESIDEDYNGRCDGSEPEHKRYDEESDCSSKMEREEDERSGEENEIVDENGASEVDEQDDEFESRFDMFDDSDGESSGDDNFSILDDDNFSILDESPTQDEDSPTLPPKKRPHNLSSGGSKGNPEVERLDMSSLNLLVGQRFESKADLQRRLKLLAVRDWFDFDVPVSDTRRLVVECWVQGCLWKVCATRLGDTPAFYVRGYDSVHTCSVTERFGRSRQATTNILAELYKDFLGDVGPSVRPNSVGISITKHFGVKMGYWKSFRTLTREMAMGTPESGFENLTSYLYKIRRANPGTVTHLEIDEFARFMYVFLAFGASVNGFPFMCKVVVVDGTFLNGKYKGTLLTALAQDGNFQIFPIAFGVVDTENDDSWHWFFTQLKAVIPDDQGLAIISDRHSSIGKVIGNVYPLASWGICTYHLYKNILTRYKGKEAFRLVKKAARCFWVPDFDAIYEEIEAIHPELHGYLERADVRLWARVHFLGDRYNLMTMNIAESMNRALSDPRSLSIVRLLESIRVMMTRWFAERREDARSQMTLSRGVEKILQGRVADARLLTVQRIDDYYTEVTNGSFGESSHMVSLEAKTCTCRRFQHEKLPCVHAIAAAEMRGVSRISLCSQYYNNNYLVNAYAKSIMLEDSALALPENVANQPCFPPVVRQPPEMPKKSRMKSALEVACENKRPRKEHTCSRCNQGGHNARTCPM